VKRYRVAVLPGDGIGPEVTAGAVKVLNTVAEKWNLVFEYIYDDVGGTAIDKFGTPLKQETLELCRSCHAVILGAVGGPKWETTDPQKPRPEQGLLALRKELGLFANLRPVKLFDGLVTASTIKEDVIKGVDIMVMRELTGDVYFGKRERIVNDGRQVAYDTMIYADFEVDRIARLAFEVSRLRGKKVTSVDKANILESSRLWRERVMKVHEDYQDVNLNHLYVDNASMQLILNPRQFDVILTSNMFGDILSDECAMLTGSIGMLPSASLNEKMFGMFEPIHGSAPDIAGEKIANPIASILSAAMMLRFSLNMHEFANRIEEAVAVAISSGFRTKDIYQDGTELLNTNEMTDEIIKNI
jgi:3-isopropylmalate dehydrogenase